MVTNDEKTFHMEQLLHKLFSEMGFDMQDPNLIGTPKRIVKMYQEELFSNYGKTPTNIITSFPNEDNFDEIIMMDNIPFVSTCSHHGLPFPGLAWLAYIPDSKLSGASKPARVLDFFAKKPQLQEKLSTEVVDFFMKEIQPKGIMLVMRAIHGCMSCRGVKTGENAGLITSITRGCFRDNPETRSEALDLIKLSIALRR